MDSLFHFEQLEAQRPLSGPSQDQSERVIRQHLVTQSKSPKNFLDSHKLDTDVKLEASLTHITVISHPVQEAAQGLGAG